jgi:hypothetical protein
MSGACAASNGVARDHARDQTVEIDLLDMHAPRIDRLDDAFGHVDAEHARAGPRDDRRGGQADIAQPHDDDVQFSIGKHDG